MYSSYILLCIIPYVLITNIIVYTRRACRISRNLTKIAWSFRCRVRRCLQYLTFLAAFVDQDTFDALNDDDDEDMEIGQTVRQYKDKGGNIMGEFLMGKSSC